jgi:SAM-dependent methyltransferase
MEPTSDEIDAHDQQRRLPEPVFQFLISQLADRPRSRQPCLDAGAGSGMITVPLAEAGLAMIALDRSPAMLARLTERATRVSGLQIVLGDMTALPFADHTFGSVVVANVFHLIEAWEQAISELVRVLVGDGILLVNLGGAALPDELARLTDYFLTRLATPDQRPHQPIGPASVEEFDTAIRSFDLTPERPIEVEYEGVLTPEAVIQRLERNIFARPVGVPKMTVQQVAKASRTWARRTIGSVEQPFQYTQRIVYRVYAK